MRSTWWAMPLRPAGWGSRSGRRRRRSGCVRRSWCPWCDPSRPGGGDASPRERATLTVVGLDGVVAAPPRAGAAGAWRAHRRRLVALVMGLVLALAGVVAARRVDADGRAFLGRGRAVVAGLDGLAHALHGGDLGAVARAYADDYAGTPLGLARRVTVRRVDGIRALRLVPAEGRDRRAAALAEWRAYLASFAQVEEAGAAPRPPQSWRDPADVVAEVRFELIGTPRGAPRSGIDRAPAGCASTRRRQGCASSAPPSSPASGVEGDRPGSRRRRRGRHRFHQPLLPGVPHRPLRFGMIRYGPGGITAVDFDGDGFYDLFVPDGVASRLFRTAATAASRTSPPLPASPASTGSRWPSSPTTTTTAGADLFVSRTFRPNQLFHNDGPTPPAAPLHRRHRRLGDRRGLLHHRRLLGRLRRDGRLDLYVGRYLDPRQNIPTTLYTRNGEPNQLYHNDGGGQLQRRHRRGRRRRDRPLPRLCLRRL